MRPSKRVAISWVRRATSARSVPCAGRVERRLDDAAVLEARAAVDRAGHQSRAPVRRASVAGPGRHGRLLAEELDVDAGALDVPVAQQPDQSAVAQGRR